MENFDKINEKYRNNATRFANEYDETVSDHVIDIMVSIMMTRDKVMMGGSFVQAVVLNQLFEAINRADKDCLNHLKLLTLTNKLCFI